MEYSGSFETYLNVYSERMLKMRTFEEVESNFLGSLSLLNYKIYLNKFYANDNNLTIKLINLPNL